jgi:3-methyladenine DNA glycosylase AlkC
MNEIKVQLNFDSEQQPTIPEAPRSIQKGTSLKELLSQKTLACLARNISLVYPDFASDSFVQLAVIGLEPLGLLERGHHIAGLLREHLPEPYEKAVQILIHSMTPPLLQTNSLGLGVFFYLPHSCFIGTFGLDSEKNGGRDPFGISMKAQYELTRRFSAEFSIRPFLIRWPERTLNQLLEWTQDADPHVRRLCAEGTRPRLPWAMHLLEFIKNPEPVLPILEKLKDDPDLYVRRSVANHLGDIAKNHLELVLGICNRWLQGASPERRWLIRHALRYPAKKGEKNAVRMRGLAK